MNISLASIAHRNSVRVLLRFGEAACGLSRYTVAVTSARFPHCSFSSSTKAMRVLCVAEKPSIAKSISQILSGGQFTTRQTANKYIKDYDFNYPQTNSFFTVTSVSGHLFDYDFEPQFSKWMSCNPFSLFDAQIVKSVKKDGKTTAQNLANEAKRAQKLMIWTDCDREGENIGAEVADVCRKANRNIIVQRARFSAIIAQQIHHAAQHPVELDMAQSNAVQARIELDLRIGAAFTRLQTLNLQERFDALKEVISYGPCQFPTLGFVVSRYNQVKAFVPEPFWYIYLSLTKELSGGEPNEITFTWKRGHLFDLQVAAELYEMVLGAPAARVVRVTAKDTKKWKPLPLTTVDLQKAGSRLLKISPKKVLDIAERLYQQGFLSYPRTETDQFDPKFDFATLIGKQAADPAWGGFATALQGGGFSPPRKGKKDDKAHPPIHPTAHAANLAGDEKRVYEYITRRFLACCSKDALGWETTVEVDYGGEEFTATGLTVRERNYLNVFHYDKWADKELPNFEQGEEFVPTVCELREGKTSKPNLLTEADLVTLMDKNGIGTDATIAQHIQTIVDRQYVIERMQGSTKYLVPSTLGIGLVEGYDAIGFDRSLSKPQLRRETERRMVEICEGTKTKNDMLTESIEQYKDMFTRTQMEFARIVTVSVMPSMPKHVTLIDHDQCVGNRLQGNGQNNDEPGILDDDGHNDDGHGGGGDGGGRGGGGGGSNGSGRGSRGGRGSAPRSRQGRGGRGGGTDPSRGNDGRDDRKPYALYSDEPPPPAPARPPRSQKKTAPASSSTSVVRCSCGVPAAERTVTQSAANKGRRFRTCGNDRTCEFFEWIDGPSSSDTPVASTSSGRTIPAKRTFDDHSSSTRSQKCDCGKTAILKETMNGFNKGRMYWRCPTTSEDAKCDFFLWADNGSSLGSQSTPPNTGTATGASNKTGSSGGASTACFKCGQEGHWSNACPNDSKPSKAASSSRGAKAGRGTRRTASSRSRGRGARKRSGISAADDF
ncbi:hypothetical protein CERSUDRAFT_50044 [Gelatoporia subvermispora B]|uniref:DNA topoisomerase n=1 Tax=Ceriporiopsis subvermispora (strain B) TaxID=914234 RepID=M2RFS6_CERS8|nr:hypothetical protein CERSUDRAFT_50044 [Gelatoporia subvermispora B]